jgi:hypothetical protein
VTVNIPLEDHSRIDDFLPDHDCSASYDIRVKAPASAVYERLLSLDFGKLQVVRALIMIRTGKRPPRKTGSGDLRQRLQRTGFLILVAFLLLLRVSDRRGAHSPSLLELSRLRLCWPS